MKYKFTLLLLLLGFTGFAHAKEVQLIVKTQTQYLMNVQYRFSSGNTVYGHGKLQIQPNYQTPEYVAVNMIPDDADVLVQIDKMNVANQTEIGDPCEIDLGKTNLTANIKLQFMGSPWSHGSFNCSVSASS